MPPALDDPQTRTSLDAVRAGGVRWLAGGCVAVVLGVLLASAAVSVARSGGQRVPLAGQLVVVLVVVGLAAAVAGAGALVRARRWAAALAVTPWATGRLRVAGPALLQVEPDGFDELTDQAVRLRLLSTAVWRTRAVQRLADGEVRYAPVGEREWVLTADGAGTLYGARTP